MIYVGIDPGKNGGFAIINDMNPDNPSVFPWGDQEFVASMRGLRIARDKSIHEIRCCLEKVGAMPGQGVTSMFSFGKSAGFIEGVLTALAIPYQLVPPQTWKKVFSLNASKLNSIEVCQKLFPDVDLMRTERCKKPHDGMAEALLMAEYARRKL